MAVDRAVTSLLFQSTLPVGGATPNFLFVYFYYDFNPRSPWGERLQPSTVIGCQGQFQSTLPVGGATDEKENQKNHQKISIHAPRRGSDVEWFVA